MPPAVRRVRLPDALAAFAAQSRVLLAWAQELTPVRLTEASAVPGWSVRDVLVHLAGAAEALRDAAATRAPALSLESYLGGYAEAAADIARAPSDQPGDPRSRLAAACEGVVAREQWPATVTMWSDPVIAADAVATRVLELVVHGDDLGVTPDPTALGLCARLLTGVLAARHPGRAVELRVPPFAAVQLLEGTVHRRGTPTAVVSCEPLAWIRLATGRLGWSEALAGGQLAASGERSDLSPYLPVLV